jgi:hypothetical protein
MRGAKRHTRHTRKANMSIRLSKRCFSFKQHRSYSMATQLNKLMTARITVLTVSKQPATKSHFISLIYILILSSFYTSDFQVVSSELLIKTYALVISLMCAECPTQKYVSCTRLFNSIYFRTFVTCCVTVVLQLGRHQFNHTSTFISSI